MKNTKVSVLLLAFTAVSLLSCGGNGKKSSNTPVTPASSAGGNTTGNLDDGLFTNAQTAKTDTIVTPDNRPTAFSAYSPDGQKIGDYKALGPAINAAVKHDSDHNKTASEEVFGSYVTKAGSDFKQFKNQKGYTSNNDEMFFYYEDGNTLNSFFCWDASDTAASLLNTNLIVHHVSGYGTTASQYQNSYRLLDSHGNTITDHGAQVFELSSTMDASVLEMPARLKGITTLDYELDLSNVKIAPPYEGCDKTYAFLGFYAWQDYYVIANGIACDTSTGNWYEFLGTSRDDSFSDVQYNLGQCVMTSTKNADGYFVPDAKTVKMSIQTKILHDAELDEDYQVDDLKIECVGQGTYERNITDSLVNEFFPGSPLGKENSYVFIAGLDIKNNRVNNQYVENTDYFNGSYFTGLTVDSAKAYVPTTDEMSDATYGFAIDADWRGKWHDILLANDEDTEGVLDYAILNTSARATYTAQNKKDVFDFSYAKDAVTDNNLSGPAVQYQAKIDSLKGKTAAEILKDTTVYDEVASWTAKDQTVIPAKYKNVLDFTAYNEAKKAIEDYHVSDEAQAVVNAINALSPIDYAGFGTIYEGSYAALSDEEKDTVRTLVGATTFDDFQGLYRFAKTLASSSAASASIYGGDSWVYISGDTANTTKVTLTPKEALDALLDAAYRISQGTVWGGGENDDNNAGKVKLMNGDNNNWPSLRVIQLARYFEANGLTLPSYISHLKEAIGYDDYYNGMFLPIYETTKLALRIDSDNITALSQLTEEELSFLNTVWVSGYTISSQISWNWNSGNKLETYFSARARGVTLLAGGDGVAKAYTYFDKVGSFLTSLGYTLNANGWGVTAATIA